jgi:zinc/manganese transport system ATP-binding protein
LGLPLSYGQLFIGLGKESMTLNIPSSGTAYSSSKNSDSKRAPILSLGNLCVFYRNHLALDNINGHFQKGSLTAIVGPNGGGKSTLLKTILGLIKQRQGFIHYHGVNLKTIAYLPQLAEIDRAFPISVLEAVAFGYCQKFGFFKKVEKEALKEITSALEEVGLTNCMHRPLHALSGGQFQRVLFARLALQNCELILLDEPFAGIDPYTIEELIKILKRWNSQGRTIIVVSHDMDLVQEAFPESLLLARKIIAWGATKDIITLSNLRKAKNLSREWESIAENTPPVFPTFSS